jgi:hypothetical protein
MAGSVDVTFTGKLWILIGDDVGKSFDAKDIGLAAGFDLGLSVVQQTITIRGSPDILHKVVFIA